MAVSLEAREPLLDHRLVEFAARLPARMRLRGGAGKWLMKRALAARLPDEILHRRKMGFVTPVRAWFRGPLAGEAAAIAHGSALAETGWFDAAAIARLADDHRSRPRRPWPAALAAADAREVAAAPVRPRPAYRSPGYSASTK